MPFILGSCKNYLPKNVNILLGQSVLPIIANSEIKGGRVSLQTRQAGLTLDEERVKC